MDQEQQHQQRLEAAARGTILAATTGAVFVVTLPAAIWLAGVDQHEWIKALEAAAFEAGFASVDEIPPGRMAVSLGDGTLVGMGKDGNLVTMVDQAFANLSADETEARFPGAYIERGDDEQAA